MEWKSIVKEIAIGSVAVIVGLAIFYYFSLDQQILKVKPSG